MGVTGSRMTYRYRIDGKPGTDVTQLAVIHLDGEIFESVSAPPGVEVQFDPPNRLVVKLTRNTRLPVVVEVRTVR